MADLNDLYLMGIEKETYEQLLSVARKENKTVAEVASEALRLKIQKEREMNESRLEKKLLCEG